MGFSTCFFEKGERKLFFLARCLQYSSLDLSFFVSFFFFFFFFTFQMKKIVHLVQGKFFLLSSVLFKLNHYLSKMVCLCYLHGWDKCLV